MNKPLLYIPSILALLLPAVACAENGLFTTFPSYTTDHSTWIVRDVNPGATYEEYITLQNLTEHKIDLEINIIESTGEKTNIKLLEDEQPKNAGLWIAPETNNVELNKLESRQIKLIISIPDNITPGEYQTVALVSEKLSGKPQLQINTRIGNRIYLNVTPSNDLKTNTFTPDNHTIETALIILSLGGIIYGTWPNKTNKQKS